MTPIINIIATASVMLLFQPIANRICPQGQFITTDTNICYSIEPTQFTFNYTMPDGSEATGTRVDSEFLDNVDLNYIDDIWVDSSTRYSIEEKWDGTEVQYYSWLNNDTPTLFNENVTITTTTNQ